MTDFQDKLHAELTSLQARVDTLENDLRKEIYDLKNKTDPLLEKVSTFIMKTEEKLRAVRFW